MEERREPMLAPIFKGWAAYGDGWAVHGHTEEEALENYRKAEQRRRELLVLPRRNKQVEAQSIFEDNYASESKSDCAKPVPS